MAWKRTRVTFSLILETLALCICAIVGTMLLLESNILASAEDVIEDVRSDPRLLDSDLHTSLDVGHLKSIRQSVLKHRVIGSVLLAVALIILFGIVEIAVQMCSRTSSSRSEASKPMSS